MFNQQDRPLYVKVDAADNVAIIVNEGGLPAGARFESGLVLRENIPEAHKVALVDLDEGADVIRYGVVIGRAQVALPKGSWVHEGNMDVPAPPSLDNLPVATRLPAAAPPLEGLSFEGFVNADGSVGTKNILGITTTVQCVAATVAFAVKRIKTELLAKYPNVDDVIALTHPYGCGIALNAPESEIPIRTLRNLALNPNLGGAPLVVSLGCEKLQPERLLPVSSLPILSEEPYVVRLQDEQHLKLRRYGERHHGDGRKAAGPVEQANAYKAAPLRPGCGSAMRRQRRFFWSYGEPRGRVRVRPSGPCRRNRDVFRSHRSARRNSPVDGPRGQPAGCCRPGAGDGVVRQVSGARRGGPQRESQPGQQARRPGKHC